MKLFRLLISLATKRMTSKQIALLPVFKVPINVPKKPNGGEDADPLLEVNDSDNTGLIAVFDGLGGSGAEIYKTQSGEFTGAHIASREARWAVEEWFRCSRQRDLQAEKSGSVDSLRDSLATRLVAAKEQLASGSKVGGTLKLTLPTTLAALLFTALPSTSQCSCEAIWAGDSRGFILEPSHGLQQITKDDIRSGGDALDNIINDSPISNVISGNQPFVLNTRTIVVGRPCIFMAATDGCFQYVYTPAHFEYAILSTLERSDSQESWRENIIAWLAEVAQDDASLVLVAIGWSTFNELRDSFASRLRFIEENYIQPLDNVLNQLRADRIRLQELETLTEMKRQDLWRQYKPEYERYLSSSMEPFAEVSQEKKQ